MLEIQNYIQKWQKFLRKLAQYKYFFFIPMVAIIFLTASVVVYQGGARNFMMFLFGILLGFLASIWVIFTIIYRDVTKMMALINLNNLSSLGNLPQFGKLGKMTSSLKHVAKANLIFGLLILILIIFAIISLLHSQLLAMLVFGLGILGGALLTFSILAKIAEKISTKLPF